MADIVDAETRSRMMAGIRARNTKPEISLRQQLHAAGLRFRLHYVQLPGRPDIVLPSRKIAIFVHGCFWHRHTGCHWCSTPATRREFWNAKFVGNLERDERAQFLLQEAGWRVGIIWECGLRARWIDQITEQLVAWIRNGTGNFESAIVRPSRTKL